LSPDIHVRRIEAGEFPAIVARLSDILIDVVDGGGGVSFMAPLARTDADAFWNGLRPRIEDGAILLLVAETGGTIAGTVQLHRVWPPNQPHRGEIAKLLVHRDFRRRGTASALMKAAEAEARALGLTLLTFDTEAKSIAERFYLGQGYIRVGYYPGYAYSTTGELVDTALFYKQL
jgi:GNAT superfamily N-acetyltransferase